METLYQAVSTTLDYITYHATCHCSLEILACRTTTDIIHTKIDCDSNCLQNTK